MVDEERESQEERDSNEFHETDFYARFHEQDASLSESADASNPADEIDEKTIQDLMDDALRKAGGRSAPLPGQLDVTIQEDWTGEKQRTKAPQSASVSPAGPFRSRLRGQQKPMAKLVVGRRQVPRKKRRSPLSRRWWRRFGWGLFLLLASAGGVAGILFFEVLPKRGSDSSSAIAAKSHLDGDYETAAREYEALRNQAGKESPATAAKLAFLHGGALEQLWRKGIRPKENLDAAVAAYEEAARLDPSELLLYSVESQLAMAEILFEEAQKHDPHDLDLEQKGRECLSVLIEEPKYKVNPAVHLGVPHQRLAERLREDDPSGAIELLVRARDLQGDLEDGEENLAIAKIYRDLLDRPVQAEEFFELVKQNELASEENRRVADEGLQELRGGNLEEIDLLPEEVYEVLPDIRLEE
jgi:tetratricopeptide (TPR) repeat protein